MSGGAGVGLLLGAGLFCCWWACWPPGADDGRPRAPRRRGPGARLREDLAAAGVHGLTPGALGAACVVAALVLATGVLAVSGAPPIAVCFGLIAGAAPVALVRSRAASRRAHVRELWPEAVDDLASGVRAGLSLPEALAALGQRGPGELRPAFLAFADDYRATGRFVACLDALKERLADPVGDRVVESLRLTREVGGSDLGRLLRTLSVFLRDDARTRAELRARQSWTVNGARLAVAAPWCVLALLATRPEAVAAYNSTSGVAVLAVGAALSALAYRLMLRLGRLPEEVRVLQ